MGQQQLLLIVLSVIIVGVAIAVGVTQFKSSAVDSNRQAVIGDLVNLAAKAQRYYRTPEQLGGGTQNFNGFALGSNEEENANGIYQLTATDPGTDPLATVTAGGAIATDVQTIYIIGQGTETGDVDDTKKVQVVVEVTPDEILTTILN